MIIFLIITYILLTIKKIKIFYKYLLTCYITYDMVLLVLMEGIMEREIVEEYVKNEKFLLEQEYHIIEELVRIREIQRMSQKKLSEMVEMSQPSLARLESKRISPGIDTMLKLLAPLGYTLDVVPINEE